MRSTSDIRVLIVEDQAIAAEAHATYVRRLDGFAVAGVARTGAEAILALRSARAGGGGIDLVLLDIHLPDMTGIDLCRSMRTAGIETDAIAVTAARDASIVRSAVSLGIVQYLIKPFSFSAFAEKLRAYRAYRMSVPEERIDDQEALDAAFSQLRPPPSNASIPKGLTAETLALVREIVSAVPTDSGVSATELAERAELSRATARRYLEHLADSGALVRRPRYGTPGRPEIEYRPGSVGLASDITP
jgi:response regulator of citrate/malate metabolism